MKCITWYLKVPQNDSRPHYTFQNTLENNTGLHNLLFDLSKGTLQQKNQCLYPVKPRPTLTLYTKIIISINIAPNFTLSLYGAF